MTINAYPVAGEAERMSRVGNVADVPPVSPMPGVITRIVWGQNMTLSVPEIDLNVSGVIHGHPHEQMIIVLERQAVLEGNEKHPLFGGDVIRIPPHMTHGGITGERTRRFLEVFSPARRDLEEKLAKAGNTEA